jgi:hypothetical protein
MKKFNNKYNKPFINNNSSYSYPIAFINNIIPNTNTNLIYLYYFYYISFLSNNILYNYIYNYSNTLANTAIPLIDKSIDILVIESKTIFNILLG